MWLWIVWMCVCVLYTDSWNGLAYSNTNYQMKHPIRIHALMNMMSAATDSGTELQYFIYIHFYLISSRQFLYRSVFQHTVMIRRTKEIWLMVDTKKKTQQPLPSTWNTLLMNLKYLITQSHNARNASPMCQCQTCFVS